MPLHRPTNTRRRPHLPTIPPTLLSVRVLRIYHSGRDHAHRERERALHRAGVELTLLVPASWPDRGAETVLTPEPFTVLEAEVARAGDVNRHRFANPAELRALVASVRPDVVDVHEEPFSAVTRQVLGVLEAGRPVVGYTAQNLDKRFPPPFARWEGAALARLQGLYPCSRQAASVAVGKGFAGAVAVLPLAPSPEMTAGEQHLPDGELRLLLVGRLVPEKGVLDAVRVLAAASARGRTGLTVVGAGPEGSAARALAADLGVADALTFRPWLGAAELGAEYRRAHVLLAPSRSTRTWVEQFGRMVVEARACGAVVVAYASGSLPEVVGDAGVVVPEGDGAALAEAVIALREEPDRWVSLRAQGLQLAEDTTWDTVAAGQLALYEQSGAGAAHTHPKPRPARAAARARFGPPATAAGVLRPHALPWLRDGRAGTAAVDRVLDALAPRDAPADPAGLRVVYVDHIAALSGGELALLRLVQSMPEVSAHIILGEDGPLRERLDGAGITVEVMPLDPTTRDTHRDQLTSGWASLRSGLLLVPYTVRLAWRIHQLHPDVVHTNSMKAGFYGSVAGRLARVPVVWHLRDRVSEDYLPAAVVRVVRLALQWLPSVVVANSHATLSTSRAVGGRGAVNTEEVVGSAVLFDPYVAPAARSHRPDHRTFVVGMVGRIASWKGQDVLLRAVAEPGLAEVQVRIVGSAMFGEDEYEAQLRALVADLSLEDRVTFTGFTDDVESQLDQLDVLVHASVLPEPFGQVVVEGMAAGLPVVASDAGGPAEIITDDVNGLLVARGDHVALAAALRRLVSDRDLRRWLGAAAQDRARDFRPDVVGPRMTSIYRTLLTQQGGSR
jgi:glycosyltransferase involved in cell wall biosynthesis